jgi:transposase
VAEQTSLQNQGAAAQGRAGGRRPNVSLSAFRNRWIAQGKPSKLAIVAVARKLAVLVNTLISEDRPWQPRAPKQA